MTDEYANILLLLGRIDAKVDAIPGIAERVRALEIWQSWLKGAWIALAAPWVYLTRHALGR